MALSRQIRGTNSQALTQHFPAELSVPTLLAPGDQVHYIGGAREGEVYFARKTAAGVDLVQLGLMPETKSLGRLFPVIDATPVYGGSHDAVVTISLEDGMSGDEIDGMVDIYLQVGASSAAIGAIVGGTAYASTSVGSAYTGRAIGKAGATMTVAVSASAASTVNLIIRSGLTVEVFSIALP